MTTTVSASTSGEALAASTLVRPSPTIFRPEAFSSIDQEWRAFQFFHEQTIPALLKHTAFIRRYFNEFIPRVALYEPVVMHVVIAIATRHEMTMCSPAMLDEVSRLHKKHRAATWKMLTSLHMQPRVEMILVACSLLVTLENLEDAGDQSARSLLHLLSGIRILREAAAISKETSIYKEIVAGFLEPVFAQLEQVFSMFRTPFGCDVICPVTLSLPTIPARFLDCHAAKQSFFRVRQWWYYRIAYQQKAAEGFRETLSLLNEWYQVLRVYQMDLVPYDTVEIQRTGDLCYQYRYVLMAFHAATQHVKPEVDSVRNLLLDMSCPEKVAVTYSVPLPSLSDGVKLDHDMSSFPMDTQDGFRPDVEFLGITEGRCVLRTTISL